MAFYRGPRNSPSINDHTIVSFEELLCSINAPHGPSTIHTRYFRNAGDQHVHHSRSPPYPSSCLENLFDWTMNYETIRKEYTWNLNFPQAPRAWDNDSGLWLPCDSSGDIGTLTPVPADVCSSHNTASLHLSTSIISPLAGQCATYSDQSSTAPDAIGNSPGVESGGMTASVRHTEYRLRVASPRAVRASRGRRKEGAALLTCEECGATFTAHHNLRHHLNAHYNIKPFPCDHCQKSFGTSHDRNRHSQMCALKNSNT